MNPQERSGWPRRLLLLALLCGIHWTSIREPFFSDDYAICAQVQRKGIGVALSDAFTKKYLDAMLDFYRPVSAAFFTLQIAVFRDWAPGYHIISLLLLLGCALLWDRLSSQLGCADPWLRAAGLLAVFSLPVWVESLSWTIAGQQDLVAVILMLAACVGFLRGSFWSLIPALAAYGAKEFAFVLAPLLCMLLLRFPEKMRRRAVILAGLHLLILGLFLFLHGRIVGGFELPYQQEFGDSLALRLRGALAPLPAAMRNGLGWSGVALLVFALGGALLHSKRSRPWATAAAVFAPLAMFLGPTLPLLLMPLKSVQFGENTRFLVLSGTVIAMILPLALPKKHRSPALLILLLLAAGGALESRKLHRRWNASGAITKTCVDEIAALPGDFLLVARLPGMLSEAYPAAQLPPFRTPGRPVFPLRLAKTEHDVIPIRPTGPGNGIAVVQPDGHVVLIREDTGSAAAQTVEFSARKAGALHLRGLPVPVRSLGDLLICSDPHPSGLLRVELRTRLPGSDRDQTWHIPFPPRPGPQRICLADIPTWPEATLQGMSVRGAQWARFVPAMPHTLHIADPPPGSALTAKDLTRPFKIDGLPPKTRALSLTLHTPGGATFPVIVPGQSFNFLQLFALGGEYFRFSIEFGIKRGSNAILISATALLDPKNPNSALDRTPLTPYSIRLPDP